MMSISELIAVVSPPASPINVGSDDDWNRIQEAIGLQLPTDLKEFGKQYGDGEFWGGEITVYNPFSDQYLDFIHYELSTLRQIHPVYNVHPKRPGLLPWGYDQNGWMLMWLTDGCPDLWPCVIHQSRSDEYELFKMQMTTFLAKTLLNDIRTISWEPIPFEARQFVSKGGRGPVSMN